MTDANYQAMMAKLDDPDYIRGLAQKHGLKIEDGKPKRERPKGIELDDDASMADLIKAVNSVLNSHFDYLEGKMTDEFTVRETKAKKQAEDTKLEAEKKKVQEYWKANPDCEKHKDEIARLYGMGHPIEEAHEMAKKKAGEGTTPETKKPDAPPAQPSLPNERKVPDDNLKPTKKQTLREMIGESVQETTKKYGSDIFAQTEG